MGNEEVSKLIKDILETKKQLDTQYAQFAKHFLIHPDILKEFHDFYYVEKTWYVITRGLMPNLEYKVVIDNKYKELLTFITKDDIHYIFANYLTRELFILLEEYRFDFSGRNIILKK